MPNKIEEKKMNPAKNNQRSALNVGSLHDILRTVNITYGTWLLECGLSRRGGGHLSVTHVKTRNLFCMTDCKAWYKVEVSRYLPVRHRGELGV